MMMDGMKTDISSAGRLHLVVPQGDTRIATDLLDRCIEVEMDKDGRTLLHIAAQGGRLELVKSLISRGFETGSQDKFGYTPLHRAAAQGHLEIIEFLLRNGCPVNQQDECGNMALHAAAWNGYSQTIDLLLRYNAHVNATNKAGFTALHSAAQKGHNQSARALLFSGCRSNIKNNYGDTALLTSARYGHAGVARILLSARCKTSAQNKNGETALHVSAMYKSHKIAKLLMDAGIKKKLKNKQNETAMDIARKLNDDEMILIINSEEKVTLMKRHKSEDLRSSFQADDNISDTKCDTSKKRRSCSTRQDKDKENSQKERVGDPGISRTVSQRSHHGMSRSRFSCDMTPEKLLSGFRDHQLQQNKGAVPPPPHLPNRTNHDDKDEPVKGLLSEYISQPGLLYYQDLAGKVRQGPVGYTPVVHDSHLTFEQLKMEGVGLDEQVKSTANILDVMGQPEAQKCRRRNSYGSKRTKNNEQYRNTACTLSRMHRSKTQFEGSRQSRSDPHLSYRRSLSADMAHNLRPQPIRQELKTLCNWRCTFPSTTKHNVNYQLKDPECRQMAAEITPMFSGCLLKSHSDETLSGQKVGQKKMCTCSVKDFGYLSMSKAKNESKKPEKERRYETMRQPYQTSTCQPETRAGCHYLHHEDGDYVLPSSLLPGHMESVLSDGVGLVTSDNASQNCRAAQHAYITSGVDSTYQNIERCTSIANCCRESFNISAEEASAATQSALFRSELGSSAINQPLPVSHSSPLVPGEHIPAVAGILHSALCHSHTNRGNSQTNYEETAVTSHGHSSYCYSPSSVAFTKNHTSCCQSMPACLSMTDCRSNPDSGYGSRIYKCRGDNVTLSMEANVNKEDSRQLRGDGKCHNLHSNTPEYALYAFPLGIAVPDVVSKWYEERENQLLPGKFSTAPSQQSCQDAACSPVQSLAAKSFPEARPVSQGPVVFRDRQHDELHTIPQAAPPPHARPTSQYISSGEPDRWMLDRRYHRGSTYSQRHLSSDYLHGQSANHVKEIIPDQQSPVPPMTETGQCQCSRLEVDPSYKQRPTQDTLTCSDHLRSINQLQRDSGLHFLSNFNSLQLREAHADCQPQNKPAKVNHTHHSDAALAASEVPLLSQPNALVHDKKWIVKEVGRSTTV